MRKLARKQTFIFLSSIALFWLTACQTPQTTVNTNQNAPRNENISLNSNLLNTNANLANSPNTGAPESVAIEAREPDTYQANIMLKAEAGGTEKRRRFPALPRSLHEWATIAGWNLQCRAAKRLFILISAAGSLLFLRSASSMPS